MTKDEKLDPIAQPLVERDIDHLSGMMIVTLLAAENFMKMIELAYGAKYRTTDDYQVLVRTYGKAQADLIVQTCVRKEVRQDERLQLGRLFKIGKEFHALMEKITDEGMKAHDENGSEEDNFNAMVHDYNMLCYVYAMMANVPEGEDIKFVSTLKLMAKDHKISDRIIARLNQNFKL